MKTRVFYFALAVAAAAIASSCVKEQAEPMDPEAEITGQVFEASHEVITKSTLVDLTPTWVEGDQISVSGSDETLVCTFVKGTENKFQTEEGGAVESPFYAIYPAADGHSVDRATGVFTATVPSLQKIDVTKGQNVAPGALVAVAQSETPELQFKNAVGLVKLNITRPDIVAVKIESINVTDENAEAEYVAGQFTMTLPDEDGDEPTVKLVEGTGITSVILNPAEENGTFEQGEYYATVLPCKLSGIIVTFTRGYQDAEGNYKTESINVRKTATTEIKRNAGIDLGSFFTYEISDADDLLAWNKSAAKWTVWDVVKLTDDINCEGVINSDNWTPNEFKGVFDGNNKTIDNFVIEKAGHAAFFTKMQDATVQDLTFGTGCSFTSTAPATNIYAASLAGEVRGGGRISNVINKGAVTVSTAATSGANDYVGGICAFFQADSDYTMTGCKNYGAVTYSATPNGTVYCAGVAGLVATQVDLTMNGCENHGAVLFNGANTNNKELNLGGVTASAYNANLLSCVNQGSIQSNVSGTHAGITNMGGIVARIYDGIGTIKGCVNGLAGDSSKGALTNNSSSSQVLRMGGCVGSIIKNKIDVTGSATEFAFKNYGTITNAGAVSAWTAVGGVVGYIGSLGTNANTVSYCENHGTVINTQVKSWTTVGGVVGFIQYANTTVTECDNYGEVKNTGTTPSTKPGVVVAGIVGRIEAAENGNNTISLCENRGQISYAAKNESDAAYLSGVAGILGGHTGKYSNSTYLPATVTISDCNNWNTVQKTENGNSNMYVGGIVAFLFGPQNSANHVANIENCINNASASVLNKPTSNGSWITYTGGIVAHHTVSGQMSGCKNYGEVTSTALSSGDWEAIRIGGIGGSIAFTSMTNCTNYGKVSDESNSNAGLVGGVVGRVVGSGLTMTNCDNEGAVSGKFNNSTKRDLLAVGGVIGVCSPTLTMTKCDNKGNVSQSNTCSSTPEMVGGLAAYTYLAATISECSSNAVITSARGTNYDYVGAFIGRVLDTASTIESSKVYGTFNGIVLSESNYTNYCFGTSSASKPTSGITFGTAE